MFSVFVGRVYNISAYLDFHPGGEDELMRGAGIDGTQLFDEVSRNIYLRNQLLTLWAHLTNGLWAHEFNRGEVNSALIWIWIIQSGQYFAHFTTAELLWQVQNCHLIWFLLFIFTTAKHTVTRIRLRTDHLFVKWAFFNAKIIFPSIGSDYKDNMAIDMFSKKKIQFVKD